MAAAVHDLLDAPRRMPTADRFKSEVLTTIGEAMRIRLAAAGVAPDLQIGGPLPVMAMKAQLELALLNVVINALDAMPRAAR